MNDRARTAATTALAVILLLIVAGVPVRADGRPVQVAATDGVLLAGQVYDAPARPSPAVVLVHMLGRSRLDWDEMARTLQASGVTVLAIDLRGHGASGGDASQLPAMVADVRGAVQWLAARPDIRSDALAVAGASLGGNLALLAAVDEPAVRAVAAVSPSLDYRGVRVGADVVRKLAGRHVWLAASTDDPLALRTLKTLVVDGLMIEQQLSGVPAHGSRLLAADPDLHRALVDWLRQRLIF